MINVLYLANSYASFIHDQIIELEKKNEIRSITNFHIDIYDYIRLRRLREILKGKYISQKVINQDITFYPGFPKNIFKSFCTRILYYQLLIKYRCLKFDIIHAHNLLPTGYVAYQLSQKMGIPYIVTTHGNDFYKCVTKIAQIRGTTIYNKSEMVMMQKVMDNASSIICVSKRLAQDVKTRFPNAKVKVIQNSYRSDIFFPNDKIEARNNLNLKQDEKIILSVGNFVKTKGHEYLIKAIPEIVKSRSSVKLILIGSGHLKKKYLQLCEQLQIARKVIIIDPVKHEVLKEWYNAADIFVLPSLDEAFGIVLVEAMACGLPAIGTKTQGPSEIIENGKTGILIKTGDHQELTEKILDLFNNNNKLANIRSFAASKMKKEYSKKNHDIYLLYKETLDER